MQVLERSSVFHLKDIDGFAVYITEVWFVREKESPSSVSVVLKQGDACIILNAGNIDFNSASSAVPLQELYKWLNFHKKLAVPFHFYEDSKNVLILTKKGGALSADSLSVVTDQTLLARMQRWLSGATNWM